MHGRRPPFAAAECLAGCGLGTIRSEMSDSREHPTSVSPRHRWQLFEQLCGERVRASDEAWARGLLPAGRLAVLDDLFLSVRAARLAAGDWDAVEAAAWQETLSERMRQVRAFRRLDEARRAEAMRGTGTLADAG